MAKAAFATARVLEFFDDLEFHLLDRHENHLCDALAWLNLVGLITAIPAGNKNLSLVVGIDQSGQVAKYKPVFVPES